MQDHARSIQIAAITNDIYTREDAEFLTKSGALPPESIHGVETGGCPHTAIREDASINLAAIAEMNQKFPDLDLILVESGGDNLAATFSPELADLTIYVIDVAAGDKIPRKGGPGITRSDLLVINKTDLAPLVGANLEIMDRDARQMRAQRPFVFTNLKAGEGVDEDRRFHRHTRRAWRLTARISCCQLLSCLVADGADPQGGVDWGSASAPLAIYIHWPFCRSKCPYCDFNSHVRERHRPARWTRACWPNSSDRPRCAGAHGRLDLFRRRHALADAARNGGVMISGSKRHGRIQPISK